MAALAATLVAGVLAGLGPLPGIASSHREAPLVFADPQIDTTDVWAFVSEDRPDTVTVIGERPDDHRLTRLRRDEHRSGMNAPSRYQVTAPCEAEPTARAYLASAPFV